MSLLFELLLIEYLGTYRWKHSDILFTPLSLELYPRQLVPLSQTLTEFIVPGTFLLASGLRPCMHTHTHDALIHFLLVHCVCVMYSKCPGNIDTKNKTHECQVAVAWTGSGSQTGLGNEWDAPQLCGLPPAVFIQRLLMLYLRLLPRKHLHFVNSALAGKS